MTTDKIKSQLISYNRQFKQNYGLFKSFEVVYDYINFLNTEPYLVELLKPAFGYVRLQMGLIGKAVHNAEECEKMENIMIDPANPNLPEMSFLQKEFSTWQNNLDNVEQARIMSALSLFLINLVIIADTIQEVKDCLKSGDIERANELIEAIKDESLTVMSNEIIKGVKPMAVTSAQYVDVSMEMVNKHIIDHMDAQALLNNDKPKLAINFDSENSILNIRSAEVKIARRGDPPIEHFVLVGLFGQADISDPLEFHYIARDIMKDEDYEPAKGWAKFRSACDRLNQKVDKSTNGEIKDFIEYTTGRTGWCKINPKYI